jgi:hypothetical protein
MGIRLAGCCLGAVLIIATPAAAASPSEPITRFAGNGSAGTPLEDPALSSPLAEPTGIAVDARGDVYLSNYGDDTVDEITPEGHLSVVAGDGGAGAPTPGPATSSELGDIYGLAVDGSGDLYIADRTNSVVEKVTPAGILSIAAGDGTAGAPTEGPATSSELGDPEGVAVDSHGNLYIVDEGESVIEKVTPEGHLSVIAGVAGSGGAPTPGPALESHLSYPDGVAVDAAGNVYIADFANFVFEKVTPSGTLSILAGKQAAPGMAGEEGAPQEGVATSSPMYFAEGVAVDASGNVYLATDDLEHESRCEIDEVTGEQLHVIAGAHACGEATYGGAAGDSSLNFPAALAVNSAGVLFDASYRGNAVDRIGPLTPSSPTILSASPGDGSASIVFDPPVSTGTSPLTGYEVSTDGGVTWHAVTTSAGPEGALDATVTGLSGGATYDLRVRAANGHGAGEASGTRPVTLATKPTAKPAAQVQCRSDRTETIHWMLARGVHLARILVTVDGRVYRRLSGAARHVVVSLKGRGAGSVVIKVIGTSPSGARYETSRTFKPCVSRRTAPRLRNLHLIRR